MFMRMARATKAEKARLLNAAYRLLGQEMERAEAARHLGPEFALSRRQAYRYLQEAAGLSDPVPAVEPTVAVTFRPARPSATASPSALKTSTQCYWNTRFAISAPTTVLLFCIPDPPVAREDLVSSPLHFDAVGPQGPLQPHGRTSGTKGIHSILIRVLVVTTAELCAAVGEDAQQPHPLLLEERQHTVAELAAHLIS